MASTNKNKTTSSNISLLQSSLSRFSCLSTPKDATSCSDNFIPLQKNVQKVVPSTKISNNNSQIFLLKTNQIEGHILKMVYLKIYIPEQYAESNLDIIGVQSYGGLKLISSVNIKINGVNIESFTTESLYSILKKVYNENWDYFCKEYIGESFDESNLPVYCSGQNSKSVIMPSINYIVPLPFGIFTSNEKFKNCLLRDKEIEIEIVFNQLDSIFIKNSTTKITKTDGSNNLLLIESLKYENDQVCKNTEFLGSESHTRPYFFLHKFHLSSKVKLSSNGDFNVEAKPGDVMNIKLIGKNSMFNSSNVFYGHNAKTSILNYFNSFVINDNPTTLANKKYVFDLKYGTFFDNNKQQIDNSNIINLNVLNANTYIFEFILPLKTHSIILECNKPWSSLSESVYFYMHPFINNYNKSNILNLFHLSKLSFIVQTPSLKYIHVNETVNDYGNKKVVGALYLTKSQDQVIVGFGDYKVNSQTSPDILKILASNLVDFSLVFNKFVTFNFLRISNILNNSYDIENSIKIEFDSITLNSSGSGSISFDKDLYRIYSTSLDNANIPTDDYSNFIVDFSGLNTSGSRTVDQESYYTIDIGSKEVMNSIKSPYFIQNYINESGIVFEFCVLSYVKKMRFYYDNSIHNVSSFKNIQLVEKAIRSNFFKK